MGWMRRRGRLELILVLPDGSHLMVPAGWTDLRSSPEPAGVGTLGSLADLLAARRVLEPLLERVVLAERDDRRPRSDRAAASGTGGEPGAGGGVVVWELVGEQQRQAAMALLAALIAQTVGGEAVGDERASLGGAGAAGGRDD
jgi:hypothetical protein